MTGHWVEWYDNGNKKLEGDYLNGQKGRKLSRKLENASSR